MTNSRLAVAHLPAFARLALVHAGLVAASILPPGVDAGRAQPVPGSGVRDAALPTVLPNDNRHPAGALEDGAWSVRLEARRGMWHPQGADGPGFPIEAFAEEGGAPTSPGPLLRVPLGAEVRVMVRNTLDRPLRLHGLHDRGSPAPEPVEIGPGESRQLSFRASAPGTYYYWGRTTAEAGTFGRFEDGQLGGAFVVDAPGGRTDDRILVVNLWVSRGDTEADVQPRRHTFLVNGLSWPFTERLAATVGDSVTWRVINASVAPHPMHLHGFYYRVDARGDVLGDTIYDPLARRLAVTENLASGHTMTMSWLPKREGHWLFHCHFIAHIEAAQRLREREDVLPALAREPAPGAEHDHLQVHEHAFEGMAGLISGVLVTDPGGRGLREDERVRRRRLRVYANARPGWFGDSPAYSYVLQEGPTPPAPDSIRIPGTPIVLARGEPAEITVTNRTPQPISVHWHGIELDAWFDGVAGWSGVGGSVAPMIAPGDSFAVRFTPDRAGTFIYHTHMEESHQLSSGLYAPLIVLEPGQRWEPDTDRIFLMGWGGPGEDAPPFLNGSAHPTPVELAAGKTYRLRFINITPSHNQDVRLLEGDTPIPWRRFAKDGAELPAHQAVVTPAVQHLGAGETYDFELVPDAPGELTLELTTYLREGRPPRVMRVPVLVR